MQNANCPTLMHYSAAEECLENLAGLGEVVYIGLRGDLAAPMTATDDTYSAPSFKSGNGLYKFDLKEEAQKIAGESQGKRKGYNITGTIVFDGVDKKVRIDQGGATTDTGAAASDDRISTVNFILGPVKYPNLFVTAPSAEGGWDTMLAGDDSSD